MKIFRKYNSPYLILAAIAVAVICFSTCLPSGSEKESYTESSRTDSVALLYTGSDSCASCHSDIYKDHLETAHFLTSKPADPKFFSGNFSPGQNVFAFDQVVSVTLEKRDSGYYQVEYHRGREVKARKIDIVVGSGIMGQSFLNWRQHYLFQMPITWFSAAGQWSNSPGFPNKVVFNRVITSRCLECHTTYVQKTSPEGKEPEQFSREQLVYGVDCEKCHGPGKEHVNFQRQHPDSGARHIIQPGNFTRQQQLDLCALCHGGRLEKTAPSFTYVPGRPLSEYFALDTVVPDPQKVDVHGNQYGLLRSSPCFINSDMTCNTCHDPHKKERGDLFAYSQKCMSCHQPDHKDFCPMEKQLGKSILSNCIDCHMSLNPSRAIAVFLPGAKSPVSAQIRSHYISRDQIKKVIPFLQK